MTCRSPICECAKRRIDDAAKDSGRSINSEVVDRLQRSFETIATSLNEVPDGLLLDEVLARYGARLQTIVAPEIAEAHGIGVPAQARAKKSRSKRSTD